jgi:2-oxoglutarate ferredoxin oxidoreductase subunit alpha
VADMYRTPVMILGDGMMGQIVEPVIAHDKENVELPPKDYILNGASGRPSRIVKSLVLDVREMEEHNWKLKRKYDLMKNTLPLYEKYKTDDAKMTIIAYGTAARIAKGAVNRARSDGLKIGLFRPITLWPFPDEAIISLTKQTKLILVFEMSTGQMIDDVRLAIEGKVDCEFYGRPGGIVPAPQEIARIIERHWLQKDL